MENRGMTPMCEAYCALAVASKDPTNRELLTEYNPRALDQIEQAMTRLTRAMSGVELIAVCPSHTEVMVVISDGNAAGIMFRGMVRDMPGIPRRITNLDSGTEFFTDPDVPITVDVTKVPERKGTGQFTY